MKVALDTNVLVYAHDSRDRAKQATAIAVVDAVAQHTGRCLALQVVGEFYSASTRRLNMDAAVAARHCEAIEARFPTYGYDASHVLVALRAAGAGALSYWDGLLLAASIDAGCDVLISEDMQSGFKYRGLEVISPFDAGGALNPALSLKLPVP